MLCGSIFFKGGIVLISMNKRVFGAIVIGMFAVVMISGFASAGLWGDFVGKITGKVIDESWTPDKAVMVTVDAQSTWNVIAAADFDGDGVSDLLLQKPSIDKVAIWFMNSNGTIKSTTSALTISSSWKFRGAADADGDGVPDVIWQKTGTGKMSAWLMESNGSKKSVMPISSPSMLWQLKELKDLDSDGIVDTIWKKSTDGKIVEWLMSSNGTQKSVVTILDKSNAWNLKGEGDVDRDGVVDFVWQNSNTGNVNIWFMESNGSKKSQGGIASNKNWQIVKVEDMDGDGIADFVLQHSNDEKIGVWLMNSNGSVESSVVIFDGSPTWKLKEIADMDGDGINDLVWQKTNTGAVVIWFMNANLSVEDNNESAPQENESEAINEPNLPNEINCTGFTYSNWTPATCSPGGQQTRTITSVIPGGCTGGNPVTSQSCTYEAYAPNQTTPPPVSPPTPVENLTCAQMAQSLGYIADMALCICPTCNTAPPTTCARLRLHSLPNTNECTYCCVR